MLLLAISVSLFLMLIHVAFVNLFLNRRKYGTHKQILQLLNSRASDVYYGTNLLGSLLSGLSSPRLTDAKLSAIVA